MSDLFTRLQATLGEDTYHIERELGGGGMSQVFLATEVELGRKVVIKVLPPDMAAGVNKERFQREIKLAASLQHPHIVQLLTAGSAGDLIWYVMPYIEGESLRQKLAREGELPIAEAARLLSEVTDALAYAHESGVVHRDIKPDNVMLSRGHALVTDFGVAKAVSASSGSHSSLTSLGVALGTPAYMSPEQAAADPHVDHRADIYAVGALAYEMLTGRPPFVKQTPQQVLAAHVNEEPEPVTGHRASVPPRLAELVMRCLAKRPADRWQSAEALRSHLAAVVTPESGGMTPTGTAPVASFTAGSGAAAPAASPLRLLVDTPVKVAAMYGATAAFVLLFVYAIMVAIGLPDWVFVGAIALMAIGLPIVMVTGRREQSRAAATATGIQVATPVGLDRHFTWKKAIVGGGVAFAGLGVIAGGWMGMRSAGIGPAATLLSSGALGQNDALVLAEFGNRTSDSTLGATVTELLRVSLSQSTAIHLLDPARVSDALQRMQRDPGSAVDEQTALEIAERDGYKAVLSGTIAPLGSGYVVSARLLGANGEVLTSGQAQAGSADELIGAVGDLTADLREDIGESLRSIRRTVPLDLVTTGSMQALRLYTQAALAEVAGDDDRALDLLEESVSIDTTFAMAYRKIGTILSNTGQRPDRMIETLTRAYDLRNRLTELERGYAVAQYHSSVTGDNQAALDAYRTILEQYPDDHRALNNTGVQYLVMGNFEQALEFWKAGVRVDSTWSIGFSSVAIAQAVLGRDSEAAATLEAMEARFADNPRVAEARANVAAIQSRFADAEQLLTRLLAQQTGNVVWESDANERLGQYLLAQGKVREADKHLRASQTARALRNAPGTALRSALVWATARYQNGGEKTASDQIVNDALASYPVEDLPAPNRPYLELIDYYVVAGELDQARRWWSRLEASGQLDMGRSYQTAADLNRGFLEIAEGNASEGLARVRTGAEGWWCVDCGWAWLARAFDLAEEPDSALVYWKKYADFRPWYYESVGQYRASAYRRVGELYEERGERDQALDYYNRFVDLWENADAELQPIVEDARRRMAALAGETR